jgi:alkylhydroperoxidase family enzyme
MRVFVPESHAADPQSYVSKAYPSEVAKAGGNFSRAAYQYSTLSVREFEAARARTADINGCLWCQTWRSARDVPAYFAKMGMNVETVANHGPAPDEAFYAAVNNWRDSNIFTPRERIALEYAEGVGVRPKEIAEDEDFWKRAHALYSDAEIIDLTYCLASWIAMGRVTHVLGFDAVCMPSVAAEPLVA